MGIAPGARALGAALLGLAVWLVPDPGARAQAPAAEPPANCRDYGAVLVCAMHVSITPLNMGPSVRVEGSVALQVRNSTRLPVRVFFNDRTDIGSIAPDRGPVLSGPVAAVGLPICRAGKDCLLDRTFAPLSLSPSSTANVILTLTRDLPIEVVQHMALATSASFTGSFEIVDGDGQFSKLSLSLPVASLDNGLTK